MKTILRIFTVLIMSISSSQAQTTCSSHRKSEIDWCFKRNDKNDCNKIVENRMASCLKNGVWEYRSKPVEGLKKI